MKVIVAYDGSAEADAAIDDLSRAGIPRDAELLIASVADFSKGRPAVSEFDLFSAASRRIDATLEQVRQHEARVLEETQATAAKAMLRLRRQFPEWNVHSEVLQGEPADALLGKIGEWKADVIIGGSHGRSAIGRFFLGSVSKSVAEQAPCSVRVVRRGFEKTDADSIELVLGAKNPAEAERIVEAVGRRVWPADTRIRMVVAADGGSAGNDSAFYPGGSSIYETAAKSLENVCLKTSVQIESGDPKTILLDAAEAWRADAIFIDAGAASSQGGLDEMAAGLITAAKCTVEIVR